MKAKHLKKPENKGLQHRRFVGARRTAAFTLIETVISVALLLVLIISSISAILFLHRSSSRLSEYVAATSFVKARIEAIRGATYNPPNSPFTGSTCSRTIRLAHDN